MTENSNPAPHQHCSICSQLEDYHYALQTHGRPEEDTFIPKIAGKLKNIIEVKPGTDRYTLLRRCPECATYYLYKIDYEYLATGTEDEQFLTRLTDAEAARYLAQPLPD